MRKYLLSLAFLVSSIPAWADWPSGNGSNPGTVTSVATDATLSGGPVTGSGTLTLNLGSTNTWTASQKLPSLVVGKSTDTATTRMMMGSASLDYGATAAGACDDLTITVSGAADGNKVIEGIPNALAATDINTTFDVFVSAANTVDVRRCCTALVGNCSNPAAATVSVTVFQ